MEYLKEEWREETSVEQSHMFEKDKEIVPALKSA